MSGWFRWSRRDRVCSHKSPPCSSVRQKCRSERVRERARTVAEDSAFKTPPSRTSEASPGSLLQKPGVSGIDDTREAVAYYGVAFSTPSITWVCHSKYGLNVRRAWILPGSV
ncbi:hypothetical protein CCL12_28005 [Pseudomonas syringae]|nr:hypothetical protein CCL12_28005 [Pseudomonas syringae]